MLCVVGCDHQCRIAAFLDAVCCVLCAVCCVLCAVCCVLCAVCCVLCAVCCVLCAVCCVLCAVCCVLCAVCCVLCAVCCVLCAVCCVLCAVCCVLCAVCCVLCAVCCVLCAVCCVLCAVCCVLCAVCCVLCAVCCVLCAVCCVLCAVCCVLCAVCCVLCAVCWYQVVYHHLKVCPVSCDISFDDRKRCTTFCLCQQAGKRKENKYSKPRFAIINNNYKRGKALSIRTSEPTLNQIAKILYTKVTHTIIALLKGLEYTLTFSIMHKQTIIGTKITISLTPIPLEVTIRWG